MPTFLVRAPAFAVRAFSFFLLCFLGDPAAVCEGASISGALLEHRTGTPIAGGTVLLAKAMCLGGLGCWMSETKTVTSDPLGRFEFLDLTEGNYVLVGEADGFASASLGGDACFPSPIQRCLTIYTPTIAVGMYDARVVDLSLEEEGLITGTILLEPEGVPAPDHAISAVFREASGQGSGVFSVPADSEGRFEIRGLPAGEIHLLVEPEDYWLGVMFPKTPCDRLLRPCGFGQSEPVVIAPGTRLENVEFRLEKGAMLSISLRDAVSGAPVDLGSDSLDLVRLGVAGGAADPNTYSVIHAGGRFGPVLLDPFKLGVVGSARYADQMYGAAACTMDDCGDSFALESGEVIQLQVGESRALEFELQPRHVVSGRVIDADDRPLADIGVCVGSTHTGVWDADYEQLGLGSSRVLTAADGRFLISGFSRQADTLIRTCTRSQYVDVMPGNIACGMSNRFCTMVEPLAPEDVPRRSSMDVGDLRVIKGSRIEGRAVRAGRAASRVYLLDPITHERLVWTSVDTKGRYAFSGLAAMDFKLLALAGDYSQFNAEMYPRVPCKFSVLFGLGNFDGPLACDSWDSLPLVTTGSGQLVTAHFFDVVHTAGFE